MKKIIITLCAVLILLASGGVVFAETTAASGVTTNVYFCKMTKVGEKYEFEPLPTQYTGENDYGRMTFVSTAPSLQSGDYAIVQDTPDGIKLIQSLKLEALGTPTPEYTLLTLELTKTDLPVPLEIIKDQSAATVTSPAATTPASTAAATPLTTSSASANPTTAKSPLSPLTVLGALGLSGIALMSRKSN
jgi:hypothetical protein